MSAHLSQAIARLFDADFYRAAYPDIVAGVDPLQHYLALGVHENRSPNAFFDAAWYAERLPAGGSVNAMLHYLTAGAAQHRHPHPRFDALWYLSQHPEAAGNLLLHHLRVGIGAGWPTEKLVDLVALLPAPKFPGKPLPAILFVRHALGGGLQRHLDALIRRLEGQANALILEGTMRGVALSVPAMPNYPAVEIADERLVELAPLIASFGVARVHIHHAMEAGPELHHLIRALAVPFDVTVHDYHAICPQIVLLPFPDQQYCGEPEPAGCNACIATRPSYGATDILTWRASHRWMFAEADRVICPTQGVFRRLTRHGLAGRAIVAAHEPGVQGVWPISLPKLVPSAKLRVALLGILAAHKGLPAVLEVLDVGGEAIELMLIGDTEAPLPAAYQGRLKITGHYEEVDLPGLLAREKPHVVWFPAQWPETYSYTLSAAIEAGLPIVASDIGAFSERLVGRPLVRLVDPAASAQDWLAAFSDSRRAPDKAGTVAQRPAQADFYARDYLAPLALKGRPAQKSGPTDLRRAGRLSVVVVPETFANGAPTPCAFIRLLLPLDHPAIGDGIDITVASPHAALGLVANIVATQRYALPNPDAADALATHCSTHGMTLLYDLDDDLLHVPPTHPEAAILRPKAATVARMLEHADTVWVSTPGLKAAIVGHCRNAIVVANGLDERLWSDPPASPRPRQGPVRILCMGTATHDADFDIVAPALVRLHEALGDRIRIDLIGFTNQADLPPWLHRSSPPPHAAKSYPGFVNWMVQQRFDIGIAPLAATKFNSGKSAIKAMDYAALGLAVLASNVPAYGNTAATLVENTANAWLAALARLIRDPALRQRQADTVHAEWRRSHTLHAQSATRRAAWFELGRRRE